MRYFNVSFLVDRSFCHCLPFRPSMFVSPMQLQQQPLYWYPIYTYPFHQSQLIPPIAKLEDPPRSLRVEGPKREQLTRLDSPSSRSTQQLIPLRRPERKDTYRPSWMTSENQLDADGETTVVFPPGPVCIWYGREAEQTLRDGIGGLRWDEVKAQRRRMEWDRSKDEDARWRWEERRWLENRARNEERERFEKWMSQSTRFRGQENPVKRSQIPVPVRFFGQSRRSEKVWDGVGGVWNGGRELGKVTRNADGDARTSGDFITQGRRMGDYRPVKEIQEWKEERWRTFKKNANKEVDGAMQVHIKVKFT
ncbi:hypothetical protein BC830DRAFT_888609 [Chytriomyces sp. MP71]|nr:hypothetical protein BC830DRAFT_888609 [Chytriomyces sp. MP71]